MRKPSLNAQKKSWMYKYNRDILMDVRCKNHYGCVNISFWCTKYNMDVLTWLFGCNSSKIQKPLCKYSFWMYKINNIDVENRF